ncbi:MAG TPA: response regulator transcription factor [Cellulomonas sp.]
MAVTIGDDEVGGVPGGDSVRIGIVDDHEVATLGVVSILDGPPDLQVVGSAPTVAELLADHVAFDVVVLDLRLGDSSSPQDNVAALQAAGAHVLAYTSGEDPALVRAAARAGVSGMVRKSEPPAALIDALRQVARDEVAASVDWAAAIDADRDNAPGLTAREVQVLALYASGEKADRVARLLGIARDTVLDHVRRIRVKYAEVDRPAPTKVDLYRRAVEDGVLREPQ